MNKIAFIGPLPPPLGGVAIINQSFQKISYSSCYEITYFNTSDQNRREDLYKKFQWSSIPRDWRKNKNIEHFI